MKYIGGEFSQCNLDGYLNEADQSFSTFFRTFETSPVFFETASDGMAAIINEITVLEPLFIYFPSNYCRQTINTILTKCLNKKLMAIFYEDIDTLLTMENVSHVNKEILVIMHFNSVYAEKEMGFYSDLAKRFTIIEDYVQYPFDILKRKSKYAVNSLRKVLPIELAVTYGLTNSNTFVQDRSRYYGLKKEAVALKDSFLSASYSDNELESAYLKLYQEAESSLNESTIFLAQQEEVNLATRINFTKIQAQRRENYKTLYGLISDIKGIQIIEGDYMFMMILTDRQKMLKQELAKVGIFAPVHWADSDTDISKRLLSIPIDQRYNEDDMDRVGRELKAILSINLKPTR